MPESVTYVPGMNCYPCVDKGTMGYGRAAHNRYRLVTT